MKTKITPRRAATVVLLILGLSAPIASADVRLASKGRAGYAVQKVPEPKSRSSAKSGTQDQRATTIAVSVGDPRERKTRLTFAGGRSAVGYRRVSRP